MLLDRADIATRLHRVQEATAALTAGRVPNLAWHAGQLLSNLVAGAGRAARGERLSGHQLVRVSALGHLVAVLRAGLPQEAASLLDDLDPSRRLERALPGVASDLDAALRLPVIEAAGRLLALLVRLRPELVSQAARAAVERALSRAAGAGEPPG